MKLSQLFPSKYLKADDLQGRQVTMTISGIGCEEVGQDKERKPVLRFAGTTKGMVLNKTNAQVIAAAYGEDSDGWVNRQVVLYSAQVPFQGKVVEALRIGIPPATAPTAVPAAGAASNVPSGDDIPF